MIYTWVFPCKAFGFSFNWDTLKRNNWKALTFYFSIWWKGYIKTWASDIFKFGPNYYLKQYRGKINVYFRIVNDDGYDWYKE